MNVIRNQAEVRTNKINIIVATIKKAFSADLDIDKEKLIFQICANCQISRRTAMEYLGVALVSLNTEEIKFEGRVLITKVKEVA